MTQLNLAPLNRPIAASSSCFRPGLRGKIAVAMVVCLGVRAILAQAPATPAASKFVAPVEEDAQGYKVLKPHPNYYGDAKKRSEYNKLQREKVTPVLTGQKSLAEGRAAFDGFYERIFFPIMTQTSEDALRTISDSRRDLQRDLDQCGAKAADVHTHLINLTLSTLTNIVRDNFHPAVRYNAMLIISGLNDQESGTSSKTSAVPMARALPVILEEFKRPENPDAVKVAALLGLMWHLEGENAKPPTAPPNPLKGEVIKELVAFADTKDPPEGRSPDGHTWMRRRAIDALTVACQSKTDPTIVAALDKLVRDDSEPVAIRCAVAQSLGKVSLQPPTAVDVPALAKELGHVALQACEDELTRAIKQRKDEDERLARQMGTFSGEMAGNMSGDGGGMPGGGYTGGYGGGGGGTYTGAQAYQGPRAPAGTTTGGMPGDGGSGYGTEMSVDPSLLDPKSYRFDLIRRKIRQGLYCVQVGLTGGEDHQRPKAGASASSTSKAPPPSAKEAEKRGLFAVAKANEKQMVNNIYYEVRDLIDVLENRATDTFMLDREMRKKMKNLENLIGKRAITAPSGVPDEDVPAASISAAAKQGSGKAVAGKANGIKGGKGGPAAAKPAAPAKAFPGKPGPSKPTPTKTMPAPNKAAWRRPGGFAPPTVHGSMRH